MDSNWTKWSMEGSEFVPNKLMSDLIGLACTNKSANMNNQSIMNLSIIFLKINRDWCRSFVRTSFVRSLLRMICLSTLKAVGQTIRIFIYKNIFNYCINLFLIISYCNTTSWYITMKWKLRKTIPYLHTLSGPWMVILKRKSFCCGQLEYRMWFQAFHKDLFWGQYLGLSITEVAANEYILIVYLVGFADDTAVVVTTKGTEHLLNNADTALC